MASLPELSSSTPDPTSPGYIDSMVVDTPPLYDADPPEPMNDGGLYDQMETMELDSPGDEEEPPESHTRHPHANVNAWRGFPEDPGEPFDSLDDTIEVYPGAGRVQEQTSTSGFFEARRKQEQKAKDNLFYPFSGETEWKLVAWLHHSGVSLSDTDKFLKLHYVLRQPLSFESGEAMRAKIEMLPDSGPRWKELAISPEYGTPIDPVTLLYRDPLEAVADLLARPVFADAMQFAPRKIWKDIDKTKRVYSEMSSGNWWWHTQASLPEGSTVVPILLGSDQVHLSVLSGDKKAWPVYLSIGNIAARVRNKPSKGAWMIIAYLPLTNFGEEEKVGTLKMRLFHQCMEFILAPLIGPGTRGHKMADSKGAVRMCYPFVAAYLADHPEQCLINCNLQNVCPTTVATFRQMGDPTPAAPRTREWILARIKEACDKKDPAVIGPYYKVATSLGISGVNKPFWRNLPKYEPNLVMAPDLLHGPGIFWRHHLFLWIQRLVGTQILDQRLMALQPVTGYKSFKNGISHLSQWTGREDRELQRVTVALVAGTVQMKPEILRNIRAFHDFIYLAQYRSHSTATLRYLADALAIFHATKHVWIDEGMRYGEKPTEVMNHFNIPKLAMFHAFLTHVPEMGASPQFSTDITEYNHQFMAKTAYKATNRKDFAVQMCRFLDRSDRLARQAELIEWCQQQEREAEIEFELSRYQHDPLLQRTIREEWKAQALTAGESSYKSRMKKSRLWLADRPHEKDIPIAFVSLQYRLPNLLAATNEFLSEYEGLPPGTPGSERIKSTCTVDVWTKLRIRLPDVLDDEVFSVHTVNARPPLVNNQVNEPYGNCHCVLVHDSGDAEAVEIKGYRVAQVRLLFRPYLDASQPAHLLPLAYVEYFSKPAAVPEDDIFMYRVSRPGTGMRVEASVISIASIARFVQLIPVFGPNPQDEAELNANTSMAIVRDYYVNSFADKQIYQSVY